MAQSDYPPPAAIDKFLGSSTRHVRRVEIYEQDAVTRWAKDTKVRLKSGSVSVDYSRDERRTLDLVLDNSDGVLQNAPGEFWYDKIIKVWRGVVVNEAARIPKVLVLSDKAGGDSMAAAFRGVLVNAGFGDVQVNVLADTAVEVDPYDIIVGLSGATAGQITLMKNAYRAGKSVLALDLDAGQFVASAFTGMVGTNSAPDTVTPVPNLSHPVAQGWQPFALPALGSYTSYDFTAVTTDNITLVAPVVGAPTRARIAATVDPANGGKAVIMTAYLNAAFFSNVEFAKFLVSAVAWLNPVVTPDPIWETQIGEFMIDRISEPHFPHEMQITGRDYTKKCMNSRFAVATSFPSGYSLEALISAISSNAGIRKKQLPVTGVVTGKEFAFERGVSRWEAMKEIAKAYNYDLYFNAQGSLVMAKFVDPTTQSAALYIETGTEGQIASYEKSTSDTRIYNYVVVTGESSDANFPPVYAIAQNTDPDSPTNIDELGERVYTYTSAFMTTQLQCQEYADQLLAVHSLEEFELNFETLVLPWLEVGTVLGFNDPNPAPGDPNMFLLTSLTLPLGLGPMSGNARRVTIVG